MKMNTYFRKNSKNKAIFATVSFCIFLISQFTQSQENTNTDTTVSVVTNEYSVVDLNKDKRLNWAEIYENYKTALNEVNWDSNKVFTNFDKNRNESIDATEFSDFYQSLNSELERSGSPESYTFFK